MTLTKDVQRGTKIEKIYKIDKPVAEDPTDDNSPLIFTITTDVRDREGDIVDPMGANVDNYKNNAVMQWAHKYDELPIGKSVEMSRTKVRAMVKGAEVEQNAIQAAVVFQPDSNYHESYAGLRGSMVRRMYLTGFLNAVSIGFNPEEWEEIEEKIEDGDKGLVIQVTDGTKFTSWELLEFSAVPVPANPQALMQRGKEFGIDKSIIKAFLKEMVRYCTDEGCNKGRVETMEKGITDQDKADLLAALGKESLVDLSAYHRRLHMFAAQGNLMTGFTQADMDWLHAQCEAEMCKRHKADKPPTDCAPPSPLEWKKSIDGFNDLLTVAAAKCAHVTEVTERIREREEAKKPPKSFTPEEDKMTVEKIEELEKRIVELEAAMKAGRVLSASNESDLRDAIKAHNTGVGLTNGVLDQVTGKPGAAPQNPPNTGDNEEPAAVNPPKGASVTESGAPIIETREVNKDDEEIEVSVNDLLEVINAEATESDDDIIEVDEDELLAVINEETEEVA